MSKLESITESVLGAQCNGKKSMGVVPPPSKSSDRAGKDVQISSCGLSTANKANSQKKKKNPNKEIKIQN